MMFKIACKKNDEKMLEEISEAEIKKYYPL